MTHQTARLAAAVWAWAAIQAAWAVGTPAGTAIDNQAEISFELGGESRTLFSNVAVFRVAEVLDLNLLLQTPERLVGPGAVDQPLVFTLTNTGNGEETFLLTPFAALAGDEFDPVLGTPALYFDIDGNGQVTAPDVAHVLGANDPVLAADESIDILLVSGIPDGLADGDIGLASLGVEAATGAGVPGQVYAAGGSDEAIVGANGARRDAVGRYLVGRVELSVGKFATVHDPGGGARAVPGAAIDYVIEVLATGRGGARSALLADPIPANTRYVPGSLRLNGRVLTDEDDGDEGSYRAAVDEIAVALGELDVGDPARQIQFTVIIE
jgi:uncharacterized repeat protein (TIGR01451 family)